MSQATARAASREIGEATGEAYRESSIATRPAVDRRLAFQLALAVAWTASMLLFVHWMPRGWIPHDEGTLAQSALRVLDGQLPHRDYDEIYTGLLGYLDAAAFRAFGQTLMAMRWAMALFVAAWVPALFYCASRFVRAWPAALVTLATVAWSVPNYPVGMPSWYNTFFATFGLAALLRHAETKRARWLAVAGACGGVSLLFKVVGLYFVAAALLYLVWVEREERDVAIVTGARRDRLFAGLVTAALALFVAALWRLLGPRADALRVTYFVVPGAAVSAALAWREWRSAGARGAPTLRRARRLVALAAPLLAGLAVPVALFLVPYVASGSVGDLWRGVFVLPLRRLSFAQTPPLPLWRTVAALPLLALLLGASRIRTRRVVLEVAALVAVVLLLPIILPGLGRSSWWSYRFAWTALRTLGPALVVAGAVLLARRDGDLDALGARRAVAALAVFAVCAVIQFPFAAPVYFCFVLPLMAIAMLAVASLSGGVPAPIGLATTGSFLVFALLRVNPGFVTEGQGSYFHGTSHVEPLPFAIGGGVRGSAAINAEYSRLVALVNEHARGDYIYATPDCPEVYVLTAKRNPTRTLFDFFDDSTGRTARVLATLDARGVTAVALRAAGDFSGPVPADLDSALVERFPGSERVGRFTVRWR